ncbi:unnamed protein product [Linum tenue]|uniref:Dof zinc finger protein n=1 Tax=Linum tenue TaxID=586396 RepID=A0AAV0JDN0_9ROSI|nr:unnamed protein product [Linum tenue]
MGLSTKQVSSNGGLDWSQSSLIPPPPPDPTGRRRHRTNPDHNRPDPPVNCPRCDSANTKFCYYNNYNKSQPRYFCRACKRHWTKGGTLRNVPVGGGRKNKRPHKPSSGSGRVINKVNPKKMAIQAQQNRKPKQSTNSGGRASSSSNDTVLCGSSLYFPSPMCDSVVANLDGEEGIGFVFTQGLSFPNYSAQSAGAVAGFEATWQVPSTVSGGSGDINDVASLATATTTSGGGGGYWNWDVDMDNLLVSSADLNIPWDDSEILNKP